MTEARPGQWVLLSYRVPREPSTPRIAIWRKLKRLGVVQVGDGLAGLPLDARTREQLEWVADAVLEAGGSAAVWLAQPATLAQERQLAAEMAAARAEEYRNLIASAKSAAALDRASRRATIRRLRTELRRIGRRDYFPPLEQEQARQVLHELAETAEAQAEVAGEPR